VLCELKKDAEWIIPVDYSIWGALQQLVYRGRFRDVEHLEEVLQTCRLVKTLSIVLQNNLGNDCRLLLQPVEDTLSTTLTNVFGATCTLSLRV